MLKTFDPALYSLPELKFFREHLGEPPVALLSDDLPRGVNPVAVQEVLGAVYDYNELEKHRGVSWVGQDAIKEAIEVYLREWTRWTGMAGRGAPRFPSMHTWDAKGRPHRGGTGADSNQVRTWIDEKGNRHSLSVDLVSARIPEYVPEWLRPTVDLPEDFIEDTEIGRFECPLCGWTTSYNPDSDRTRNMARARCASHCKQTSKERELHHEFHQNVFGS